MKKRWILFTAAVATAALSACGSADKAYLSGIDADKYVTLGEYRGLELDEPKPEVTEEYLDMYIDYMLDSQAEWMEVSGRAVQDGDMANIDYEGKKDGTAFEGGTAQGYDLEIGSGTFIPGFEDGLIGAQIGETRDIPLTFPEDYASAELAGQEVVFTVRVNGIKEKEAQELTDEFVKGMEIEGCGTVEEFRKYLSDLLYEDAMNSYNQQTRMKLLDAAQSACVFKEPPKAMVDRYEKTLTDNLTSMASASGQDLASYMQGMGLAADNYQEEIRKQAVNTANQYIMLQAIADREDISVTDEELEAEMKKQAEAGGYASVDEYKKAVDDKGYREYMMGQRVLTFLLDNAKPAEDTPAAGSEE